jgi:TonB family protein
MMKFIQTNIQYPDFERENDIQGRVVVGFIVNEDGSLTDIWVRKGVSKGLDKEAIRVVKMFPKFKPGMQQGKAVKVQFLLPLMFKLAGDAPTAVDTMPHPLIIPPPSGVASREQYDKDFIMPEFPGGNAALTKFINAHNKLNKSPTGKHQFVSVMVTIDTKGKVTNTSIMNGLNDACNKEANRIMMSLPKFKPALKSGKPTMWYYIIPVMFID